jgi:GNAT superfamily N-acetyltransferase
MVSRSRQAAQKPRAGKLAFEPLTLDRWPDLERLFGERGACGGCWCMWWRIKRSEWERNRGAGNKRTFRRIVKKASEAGDPPPGVIAYAGDEPIGWCAIAPRDAYPVLGRSPVLKPVDDKPVWSITCLFIARPQRRQGVATKLIGAAVKLARTHGATIIEGYPVEPRKESAPDLFVFTGTPGAFEANGFREVARRSETRPIMRRTLRGSR